MPNAVGVAAQMATRRHAIGHHRGIVWVGLGLACLGAGFTAGAVLAPNPPVSLQGWPWRRLAADAELLNQRVVAIAALALQVTQQALAAAQHLHQALA